MRSSLPIAGLAAAVVTSGMPAAADTGGDRLYPEVVVSASREPVDRHKVGSAMSTLSQEELQRRASGYLSNMLRDLPSMNISRSGTFGSLTEVRLRGSENNHVLVLIDGVRANDPAFGNLFDFGRMLNFGLSRVEVLRGPQSGVYGPDALAGVISIETPTGRPGLRVQAFSEGGSFDTGAVGGRISGGVKGLTFSLFGTHVWTNGTNISRPGSPLFFDEDDGNRNTTLHGKVVATPYHWLKLTFAGRYVNANLETDADTNFDGRANDSIGITRFRSLSGIATARISLLNKAWVTRFSIAHLDTRTENRGGLGDTDTEGRRYTFTGQTAYTFATPGAANASHTVILALEHEIQEFEQSDPTGAADQNRHRSRTGVVGEYRLSLWDALFFSGALRYDANSEFDNTLTWRATLAYLVRRWGTRFHASGGRGVKNPTLVEQFGFFPLNFVGNPNLRPESSIGWDAGVEQTLFGGRLIVDATFFQSWLNDEINGFVGLGGGRFTAQNVTGTSTRKGFEFTLAAKPLDGLTIKAQYSYLISQQAGTEEIRRPRHSGAIVANYRFDRDRANVNVAFRFHGPQRDSDFGTFPATRVTLGGYVLVNLSASYQLHKHIQVYGRIQNALNQRYEEVFSFRSPRLGVFVGVRLNLDLFE